MDTHISLLTRIYEAMLELYQGEGSPEERARATLDYYDRQRPYLEMIEEELGKIHNLYNLLLEALEEQRKAREKEDRGTRTFRGKGCTVVKLVPCGKNCSGCPHGPYAYEVHKVAGKQIWKYLGRAG